MLYEDFLWAGVLYTSTSRRERARDADDAHPSAACVLLQAQVFPAIELDSHYRGARRAHTRGLHTNVGTSSFGRVLPALRRLVA